MSRQFLTIMTAVELCMPLATGQNVPLVERRVEQYRGVAVSVYAPIERTSSLVLTLRSIAGGAQVPFGIELLPGGPADSAPPPTRSGPPPRIVLTGLSAGDAVKKVIGLVPAYSWREVNGVIEVAPASSAGGFLDTLVPSFELKDVPIAEALGTVYRVFDKDYPLPHAPTYVGSSGDPNANSPSNLARMAAVFNKPISVSLKATTVRQILDAIVVAHGGFSWVVRYRSAPATYAASTLEVISFEGYSWGINPG